MSQKRTDNQNGMITENKVNREYVRGYRDGYLRGIEDTRRGLTETNVGIEILDVPLQGVGLSVRAQRCLQRAGCNNLRDAIALSEESIRRIKNLGVITADEIGQLLNNNGIYYTAWDGTIFK